MRSYCDAPNNFPLTTVLTRFTEAIVSLPNVGTEGSIMRECDYLLTDSWCKTVSFYHVLSRSVIARVCSHVPRGCVVRYSLGHNKQGETKVITLESDQREAIWYGLQPQNSPLITSGKAYATGNQFRGLLIFHLTFTEPTNQCPAFSLWERGLHQPLSSKEYTTRANCGW